MKKIAKLFTAIAVVFTAFSCADLDIDNDGRVAMQDIFGRYERTVSYYSNCINYMPKVSLDYGTSVMPFLAPFCDEAHDASDAQSGIVSDWYKGYTTPEYNPMTSYCMDPWSHYFEGIRRCNTFLININDPKVATYHFDVVEKNGWIAQVRVARAFYYLQLVKLYGGVPLMDTPYEVTHDFSSDRRATFEECADFIISECEEALKTAESEGSTVGFRWQIDDGQRGQLTRAVAYAIESETALYAASPLFNGGGNSSYTWEKAAQITKNALDQCLSHGLELYSIVPDPTLAQNVYENYFITRSDPSRSMDKETILESTKRLAIWKYAGTPMQEGMELAGSCPSQELVDCYEMIDGTQPILGYQDAEHLRPILNTASSYDPEYPYENRDPRFYASIYYNGATRYLDNTAKKVETYVGGNCGISEKVTDVRYTRTGYYLRKYNNYKSNTSTSADGFVRIFRLAELYLNFAEAAYQSAGPDVEVSGMTAREAVNKVRERVGMPALPEGLTKDQFEIRYRNERRVELAFEGHRYFDVRRWKILSETDGFVTGMKITRSGNGFSYERIKLPSRSTSAEKYLLYPIKQSEVSKMQKFTGENWQNPNW